MTTLYVRGSSGFREAEVTDILDRIQALLPKGYPTGSLAFSPSERTREFLRRHLSAKTRETFGVATLITVIT